MEKKKKKKGRRGKKEITSLKITIYQGITSGAVPGVLACV